MPFQVEFWSILAYIPRECHGPGLCLCLHVERNDSLLLGLMYIVP